MKFAITPQSHIRKKVEYQNILALLLYSLLYKFVCNVEVAVGPKFCGSTNHYKPQAIFNLQRHISKLIVIVPVDEY